MQEDEWESNSCACARMHVLTHAHIDSGTQADLVSCVLFHYPICQIVQFLQVHQDCISYIHALIHLQSWYQLANGYVGPALLITGSHGE